MKVFITTGTSVFEELVIQADKLDVGKYKIVSQISDSNYLPKNTEYFRFTDNVERYYDISDVVICHAGQGTVYTLLEKHKKFIAVPNFNFKDGHQNDICEFLEDNNLSFVAWNLEDIPRLLDKIITHEFDPYINSNSEIIESITNILKNGKL